MLDSAGSTISTSKTSISSSKTSISSSSSIDTTKMNTKLMMVEMLMDMADSKINNHIEETELVAAMECLTMRAIIAEVTNLNIRIIESLMEVTAKSMIIIEIMVLKCLDKVVVARGRTIGLKIAGKGKKCSNKIIMVVSSEAAANRISMMTIKKKINLNLVIKAILSGKELEEVEVEVVVNLKQQKAGEPIVQATKTSKSLTVLTLTKASQTSRNTDQNIERTSSSLFRIWEEAEALAEFSNRIASNIIISNLIMSKLGKMLVTGIFSVPMTKKSLQNNLRPALIKSASSLRILRTKDARVWLMTRL